MAPAAEPHHAASPSLSTLPPLPGSPSYSVASTFNPLTSNLNLPVPPIPPPPHLCLTKSDLAQSDAAYTELLASAKGYRLALASLSTAALAFGSALEACSRLKEARAEPLGPLHPSGASISAAPGGPPPLQPLPGGAFATADTAPPCTGDMLLSAAGVHHLVAIHQKILSDTVYNAFEVPLLHDMDKWRTDMEDEAAEHERAVKAQSAAIRQLEKDGVKLRRAAASGTGGGGGALAAMRLGGGAKGAAKHQANTRNVAALRAHLVELTAGLDRLTALGASHATTLLRESQLASSRIVDAACSLVRAEVDIFEALARKGWSGGGLDELLERGRDPFASENDGAGVVAGVGGLVVGPTDAARIFSILPPRSILSDIGAEPAAAGPGGVGNHYNSSSSGVGLQAGGRSAGSDTSVADGGGDYQSLAGAVTSADQRAESIFGNTFNQSRGVRPFSPQPIRRRPTDVTWDTLSDSGLDDSVAPIGGIGGRYPHVRARSAAAVPLLEESHPADDMERDPWRSEESAAWTMPSSRPVRGAGDDNRNDDDDDDEGELRRKPANGRGEDEGGEGETMRGRSRSSTAHDEAATERAEIVRAA